MAELPHDPAGLADAARYRIRAEDHVRFADIDMFGHCNNKSFAAFFEEARVVLSEKAGLPMDEGDLGRAMVRNTINYLAEMRLGDQVRIGVRVLRLGRSSITIGSAIFRGDECTATEEAVLVLFNRATKQPVEIPGDMRRNLETFL